MQTYAITRHPHCRLLQVRLPILVFVPVAVVIIPKTTEIQNHDITHPSPPSFEGPPPNQCLFQVVRHTVQFTLRVGDGMVELGPDAAESAQAQPFYFAEDLWSGRFFL